MDTVSFSPKLANPINSVDIERLSMKPFDLAIAIFFTGFAAFAQQAVAMEVITLDQIIEVDQSIVVEQTDFDLSSQDYLKEKSADEGILEQGEIKINVPNAPSLVNIDF